MASGSPPRPPKRQCTEGKTYTESSETSIDFFFWSPTQNTYVPLPQTFDEFKKGRAIPLSIDIYNKKDEGNYEKWITIKKTPEKGYSIFAAKSFSRDEKITIYCGESLAEDALTLTLRRYTLKFEGRYLYANPKKIYSLAHFINEPSPYQCTNAGIFSDGKCLAMDHIKKGDEILIDYGEEYPRDYNTNKYRLEPKHDICNLGLEGNPITISDDEESKGSESNPIIISDPDDEDLSSFNLARLDSYKKMVNLKGYQRADTLFFVPDDPKKKMFALPPEFQKIAPQLKKSTLPGAGLGIFTETRIPKDTIIGSYGGKLKGLAEPVDSLYIGDGNLAWSNEPPKSPEQLDYTYTLYLPEYDPPKKYVFPELEQLKKHKRLTEPFTANDEEIEIEKEKEILDNLNWTSIINDAAKNGLNNNLIVISDGYLMTIEEVPAGSELFLEYGWEYWGEKNKNPVYISNDIRQSIEERKKEKLEQLEPSASGAQNDTPLQTLANFFTTYGYLKI